MNERGWVAAGLVLMFTLTAIDMLALAGHETGGAQRSGGISVVINEILPAPRTVFKEEWIELYNAGDTGANIGGWSLDDIADGGSKPFVIPNGTVIPPGGFLVFHNSTTRVALNNDGDTIRLLGPDSAIVDSFTYNSSDHDTSWGRVPDGNRDWREIDSPTPGAPNPTPKPATDAGRCLLLTHVYYHSYPKKGDEFVAVANPTGSDVDLSGWVMADNDSSVIFPEGTQLIAGRTIFLTGNASDFQSDMGVLPDFATSGSHPSVTPVNTTGHWPSMPDDSGWTALRDPTGQVIDIFAWGGSYYGGMGGWEGPPAGVLEGGRLARRSQGPSGEWLDTNSSADWPYSSSTVVGRTAMPFWTFDADWVKTFVSPDCSFDAVASELDFARNSISLAVYQFESVALAEKLVNASRRGVLVRVLLEGFPVGGLTDQERSAARLLVDSGARVEFLAANHSSGSGDRFDFMHAKYCVIDGLDCIVVSENWKGSGIPLDPTYGNRGWGVIVRSSGLAAYLGAVFGSDSNQVQRDIIPYSNSSAFYGPPPPYFVPDISVPTGNYDPIFKPAVFQGGLRVSPVLSPDTSSLPDSSILAMIGAAVKTLYIEQLSCDIDWKYGNMTAPNAYLEAVVKAARRGVEVKVLLDGTYLDPSEQSQDNSAVLNYLQYTASREGLNLQALIANIPGTLKLHNKGVVVDGQKVLVSTINWGSTSVYENREVGLIIEGAGPAEYFQKVFLKDWELSAGNGTRSDKKGQETGYAPEKTMAIILPAFLLAAAAVYIVLRAGARRRRRDYLPARRRRN
jgi:hypothetical protein